MSTESFDGVPAAMVTFSPKLDAVDIEGYSARSVADERRARGEAGTWYCLDCAELIGCPQMGPTAADTNGLGDNYLMTPACQSCGGRLIDGEGRCGGLFSCRLRHNQPPWHKRAWWRVKHTVEDAIRWVRAHTTRRRHVLDLRNQWYRYGWCDKDVLMLYAAFALLKDFVEKEKAFERIEWDDREHGGESYGAYSELKELYDWWTILRAQDLKAFEELFEAVSRDTWSADNFAICDQAEKSLADKDDEMLLRLVKIRRRMWT